MSAVVRVELFGGMRLGVAGAEVSVPSTRASVLLAALVLARGAFVPSADLRGLMWPSDEPASAANQLHRLVGQVRRLFEPGLSTRDAGTFIDGSSVGYRLDPSRVRSDLEDCDAAVQAAHRLGENGQWNEATEQYLIALEIVRHPLLGDLSLENARHPGFAAVTRTRVAVAGEALTCARRTSQLEHVVGLVEQIADPMPFEESLQAALIGALAQVGRRRDAMALFEQLRNRLAVELGVDPGPDLRAAHEALLRIRHEEPATGSAVDSGRPAVRPAQLPSSLRGMTARPEAQVLLDQVAKLGDAGAVLITSIAGMGGIGKTTLAVAWAHSLAHRFPDGQLYVNLRGFDAAEQLLTPMDALEDLLLSLGVAKVNVEESLETRSARFRSIVGDRKLLLMLDNARDAEQVRPLLLHNPGCLVIVTSRNQLASLVVHEGAVAIRLDRMTDDQSRELLTHRLGPVRMSLEPQAVDRLIVAAAGLPLALAIVAARLAVDPDLGLGAVADELTTPEPQGPRLAGWSIGEQGDDLASVFDWSYRLLDDEAAECFRRLAVHPGPELPITAVASLTGHDLSTARQVVARLVGASLLERRGTGRFVIHDLLREYAESRLDGPERGNAEARLVGHYVRSTRNAWSAFGRPPIGQLDAVAEVPALVPETFGSSDDAIDWYERERSVLAAVLQRAVAGGWDRAAANIVVDWRAMNHQVDVDSYTYPHLLAAIAAAERADATDLRAELHRVAGLKAARLGHVESGHQHLEDAQALFARMGDRSGEADTLRNLADMPTVSREEAERHLRTGITLLQDDQAPQVLAMLRVGLCSKIIYDWEEYSPTTEVLLEAEEILTKAIADMHARGWTHMIPYASEHLGRTLVRLSRPREALEVVSAALPSATANPVELLFLQVLVAEVALASGERSSAARACRDFHALVETQGRNHLLDKLSPEDFDPEFEPFGRIERVEAALADEPPVGADCPHDEAINSGR